MGLIRIASLLLTFSLAASRCPDLAPPVNGVLKCQLFKTEPALRCTATCYEGHVFHTNQRVVSRSCTTGSYAWAEGPANLPPCIPMCDRALLAPPGAGASKQLSASSSMPDQPVDQALFSQPGAWRPVTDDVMQYIQVDLGSPHRVAGWMVRGDANESYVMLFRLLFSNDSVRWTPYSDTHVMEMFFTGSFDSVTEVTELLSTAQMARYVRLNPLSWKNHIALKWDLVGCPLYDSTTVTPEQPGDHSCKMPLPPVGGALNCESNGTNVVCTAYCLDGLVFEDFGPAVDMMCDLDIGLFTHTPLPACVERNATNTPTTNISGRCLQEEHDCFHTRNGDYQYCGDCHYFSTCSEGYFFVRPCPAHLRYDSHLDLCNYESSTCKGNSTSSHPRG